MGFFDWIRELAGRIGIAIDEGLRELIELHPEIRPYIPYRPAPPELIEEIVEELVATEGFIREAIPPEAVRLARGVLRREALTNVARLREWVSMDLHDIPASLDYQISVRGVVVGPDGAISFVDVAFPTGEAYSYDEFVRRAASSLEDDFAAQYDVGRSEIIRQYLVAQEPYLQSYVPL